MLRLIYWESLFDGWGDGPGPELLAILDQALFSGDERFHPYLLDLAAIPNPYAFDLREQLIGVLGDWGDFYVFGWHEARGFQTPGDDTPDYLAFKQKLIGTIQPEMGAFLDPAAERRISAQEVMWGGVAVDGIPPLNDPAFVTPAEAASWAFPSDEIIGIEINGDARAYPRRIIDWHEMVNDIVGGVPVSLAYCTLCNSAILYDGRANGDVYRFGTSGMLYRSNKLMYDTTTRTLWEQFTGVPVWGPLAGSETELAILPAVHTSYGEWLALHPDTRVLSLDTGHVRDYGPGVAYAEYWASPGPIFPVPGRDGPLAIKDVVYAVRLDGETVGFPVEELTAAGFLVDTVGGTLVVVFRTEDGSGGRAYDAGNVTFASYDHLARVALSADGRRWTLAEDALTGDDGTTLPRLPGHNAFWFAITNHATRGRLYGQ